MHEIEGWSKGRGFTQVYLPSHILVRKLFLFIQMFLSTTDKVDFYTKCGFSECPPIVNFGASFRLLERSGLASFLNGIVPKPERREHERITQFRPDPIVKTATPPSGQQWPPPPPVPIPKVPNPAITKTFMTKCIV
jgi:hypothetical protein